MNLDWLRALLGGAIIGLSASLLLLFHGRIAGISGIFGGLLVPKAPDARWRALFVGGLLAGGAVLAKLAPSSLAAPSGRGLFLIAVAGVLVGVGVRLGSGCTSGHGICGLSRRSPRSLAATLTFMFTGGVMAFVAGRLLGGG